MGQPQPVYVIAKETGPDHKKIFTAEVRLHLRSRDESPHLIARAEGHSKKSAEQRAARQALEHLEKQRPASGGSE
jgi:ribonuclease-3